jgi:phosphomethylpyrimidine synthase
MRKDWVKGRSGEVVAQMHYARLGEVTGEVARVAEREGVEPEQIRDEVAKGRPPIGAPRSVSPGDLP